MIKTNTILGWVFALVIAFFLYMLLSQKQQNDHVERVMKLTVDQSNLMQSQAVAPRLAEQESMKGRIVERFKSMIAFCISLFGKI